MTSWVIPGLLAAVGAAGVTLCGRLGLAGTDVTLATTLRSIVMTAVLLGATAATGRWRSLWPWPGDFDARAWLWILLAGLCGAASWLAYFAALRLGPAGPVAALDRLSLPLVFVLAAGLLGERPGAVGWLGLVLATAGIYLIAADAGQHAAS